VLRTLIVDYHFFEIYKVGRLAGRAFSEQFPADRLPRHNSEKGSREGTAIFYWPLSIVNRQGRKSGRPVEGSERGPE
jgi:hypothetical protein